MDGAEIGVFKEADHVSLSRLLKCEKGRGLESELGFKVLRDLSAQALEGQLADQELRRLLVLADLSERHGTRAESNTYKYICIHTLVK